MTGVTDRLLLSFIEHADIGHLALILWAGGASALVLLAMRQAAETARRTDRFMQDFLHELSRFNRRHEEDPS